MSTREEPVVAPLFGVEVQKRSIWQETCTENLKKSVKASMQYEVRKRKGKRARK